jgi:hypothetical protein
MVAMFGLMTIGPLLAQTAPAPVPTPVLHASGVATPAPAPPCPAANDPPIVLVLARGYQAFRDLQKTTGVPCRAVLSLVPDQSLQATTQDLQQIASDVTFSATKAGLQIRYDLRQKPGLHADVPFPGIDLDSDDNINLIVRTRDARDILLLATANPLAICSSQSTAPGSIFVHNQCKASPDGPAGRLLRTDVCCWHGTLTIPYAVLAAVHTPHKFFIRVRRNVRVDRRHVANYYSGGPDPAITSDQWIPVQWNTVDVANAERYVSSAADIGFNPGVPPHRAAGLVNFPIDVHDLLLTGVSDDTGPLLLKRDKTLKDILPKDQFALFRCVSCGSFQTQRTTAFDRLAKSSDVLSVDFSDLGVDSVPFSFDAAAYPIDSGYEGLFADETVGVALLNGTTKSNGVAHDRVLRAAKQFDWVAGAGTATLRLGLYHAVANRSVFTTSSGTYPALPAPQQYTTNTEGSIGYSYSNANDPFTVRDVDTVSGLIRYGTQYVSTGQRLDAAASFVRNPPFADLKRVPGALPIWAAAVGFRNLGPRYSPLDGDFDPLAGLHGYYGKLSYSESHKNVAGPAAASIAVHRFSDALEPRDVAVTSSLLIRIGKSDRFSVTSGFTVGRLAVSQVGHLSGPITVRDDQGGTSYLPNNSYSASLASTSASHQASIGYSQGVSQNCDVKRAAPPCYAYRQPSITASLLWLPSSTFFLDGAIKNQNDQALDLVPNPLSKRGPAAGEQTTAGHIVRKGAIGTFLFKGKCSTLVLSTENRGGSFDDFAKSPPKPGFINTVALELVPTRAWPTLLMSYSRQATLGSAPTRQFLARVRLGLPEAPFRADVRAACAQR